MNRRGRPAAERTCRLQFLRRGKCALPRGVLRIPMAGGLDRIADRRSSRGDQGPKLVSATAGDVFAEFDRPMAFAAEVVSPGKHAQREAMQNVFLGKADGAQNLMRNRRAFRGCFGSADLRGRCFKEHSFVKSARL